MSKPEEKKSTEKKSTRVRPMVPPARPVKKDEKIWGKGGKMSKK